MALTWSKSNHSMEFCSVIILEENEYSNPEMDESTSKSPWKAFPEDDLEKCPLILFS